MKPDPGGIVDVEFTVQFLVLAHAATHPELTGNIALLKLMASLGLIPAELGVPAGDAYREYRRRQHALRLRGERYARVVPEALEAQRGVVLGLWGAVFGEA